MLDELAGCLEGGRMIGNRIGWVRALTQRAIQGTFVPEIPIAARRNAPIVRPVRRIDPPAPPVEESLAKVTDPTLKAIMERIHRQHFAKAA
ncbi:MAG: hypothetical protein H7834_13975 [Magnetococcus sp. YQC-9]